MKAAGMLENAPLAPRRRRRMRAAIIMPDDASAPKVRATRADGTGRFASPVAAWLRSARRRERQFAVLDVSDRSQDR
jgi:hypothetical protein